MILDSTTANSLFEKKAKRDSDIIEQIQETANLKIEDCPGIHDVFSNWVGDESYFKNYDQWELTKPGTLLVRLFRYEKKTPFLGRDSSTYINYKILPFVKVIKAHPLSLLGKPALYSAGDVLVINDEVSNVKFTNEWIMWRDRMDKERPAPMSPEPEKFSGILPAWKVTKFAMDKFSFHEDDDWTFVRSENDFNVKLKK